MRQVILELILNGTLMAMLIFIYILVLYNNSTFKNRKKWKVQVILGLFAGLLNTSVYFFNVGWTLNFVIVMSLFLIFLTAVQFQSALSSFSHLLVLSVIHYYFANSFEAIVIYFIITSLLLLFERIFRQLKFNWILFLSGIGISSVIYLKYKGESISVCALIVLFIAMLGTIYFILNHSIQMAFKRFYSYYKYSRRDYLTKLYNRRKLELDIQQMERESIHHLSLAFFDVDDFKKINDTYGHAYGDRVLRVISSIILRARIVGSNAYRISGEEFCIIFKNVLPQTAQAVVESIQQDVAKFPIIPPEHNVEVHVTMSGGLIHCTFDNPPIRLLMDYADQLMYTAKNSGKNKLIVKQITKRSEIVR